MKSKVKLVRTLLGENTAKPKRRKVREGSKMDANREKLFDALNKALSILDAIIEEADDRGLNKLSSKLNSLQDTITEAQGDIDDAIESGGRL
jgi:hypothetical protein